MPNTGEEVEQLELSYIAGVSISTYNRSEKLAYLLNLNICTPYDPAMQPPSISPTETYVCIYTFTKRDELECL